MLRSDRSFIVAAFAVLFGLVFVPALPRLATHFLGLEYVDHYGTQWFYWFAEQILWGEQSPGHSDLFFFPWGKDIFGHTGANVLDALVAVPFRLLMGDVLGYNVFVLLGLAVSAWAFARFARELTDDTIAVGIGTLLFAFSPFILGEAVEGRPTQAILLLPVLFLHQVWRTGTTEGWRAPALAGLFLALTGYQYWYYAFFGGMFALAHGLWRAAFPVAGTGLKTLVRHAAMAGVALALTLPVALPLAMVDSDAVPGLLDVANWSVFASAPVTVEGTDVGLFSWQPLRRWAGFLIQDADGTERFLRRLPMVPLAVWGLFAAWMWRPGRLNRGPVLAMLAMAVLLGTGPILLVGKTALPNVAYLFLVEHLSFLQRLWWPGRALGMAVIVFGVVAVMGLAALGSRGRRLQLTAAVLAVLGLATELRLNELAPFPAWESAVPAGYACLAEGPEGAVVELPYAWTQGHLYYQTHHGRPIMGGMIENNPVFTPEESETLRNDNSWVASLIELSRLDTPETQWTEADRAAMGELGYQYVVLQKDAFAQQTAGATLMDNALRTRLRKMQDAVAAASGERVYEDARIVIYSPWGAEAPCEAGDWERDLETRGATDVSADQLLVKAAPEVEIYTRLFTADVEDETTDQDEEREASALVGVDTAAY